MFTHEAPVGEGAIAGHLRVGDIENFNAPIPPYEEQKQIVSIARKLIKKCTNLETEIQKSKNYADQVMLAVIKEAFETDKGDSVETAGTRTIKHEQSYFC